MSCQEFRKEVDAVFPEPMSRLHRGTAALTDHPSSYRRHQRRVLHRETPAGTVGRYRTQPVTFDEIKEVDEEVSEDIRNQRRHASEVSSAGASVAQSEEDLMQKKFQEMRLRRRGSSHRSTRRPFLRPSSSHDETESDTLGSSGLTSSEHCSLPST